MTVSKRLTFWKKIEVSLRTKSEAKAAKSAAALFDRLERHWDGLRMKMIYLQELGLRVALNAKTNANAKSFSLTEAMALYHRLKGGGRQSCSLSPQSEAYAT